MRQVAKAKDMDVVDCARLFALVSIAGADAYISVFDGKYAYNLWRPVTAIRNADQTNNPATPRDPACCRSAIRRCTRNIHARTASPRARCPPCCKAWPATGRRNHPDQPDRAGRRRKWTRLQDYRDEVSLARIYAGFHYRFSTEAGKRWARRSVRRRSPHYAERRLPQPGR